MTTQPDILIYLSDQHNANVIGYAGDRVVRTPNLDRLATQGTVFDAAYTSCPLCVPARMSMLSGQLPSHCDVLTNHQCLASDQATFLHSLGIEGYETTLCGRMHFMGPDQRHGFGRRLVGDITPLYPGLYNKTKDTLGVYESTYACPGSHRVVGGGDSPVLAYDRAVVDAALDLMSETPDAPQCTVVGTYGPHASYVAPPELYEYYKPRVPMPDAEQPFHPHPALSWHQHELSSEHVRQIRAAYYGMVEAMDQQIGAVFAAWQAQRQRLGRPGLFVYLSDHGDQIGHLRHYAKQTFFEGAARIPLLFYGDGIAPGQRVSQAVSIMDLAPTLLEHVGARPLPEPDGCSLRSALAGQEDPLRTVVCEYYDPHVNKTDAPGRMIRRGSWKLIHYAGHDGNDLLFNVHDDPGETRNQLEQHSSLAMELKTELLANWDVDAFRKRYATKLAHKELLFSWGSRTEPDEAELWPIPPSARLAPVVT